MNALHVCKSRIGSGRSKTGSHQMTVKERIRDYLKQCCEFVPLSDIYARLGANTIIAKAGIRGVINRAPMVFERNREKRGQYRLSA